MGHIGRRKFLKILGAGLGGSAVAAGVFYFTLPGTEKLIRSILTNDLQELNVSEKDIAAYAADAARLNPYNFTFSKWKFMAVYTRLRFASAVLPWVPKYAQFRAEIVGNFLLSTGYFWNKMNPNEPIRYAGRVYTPYNYPCGNPFSNLFYPA